ncbi:hypothetical protein Tsp_13855 [Trichinella spiralis]|uniref:hypothetical protein n=1 Tax=Trichinella spiralis TaxID=6334 RepID=UPI0001EFDA9F|nr:hypothetical protein Tsp_13855 [Trichinella spiralis]
MGNERRQLNDNYVLLPACCFPILDQNATAEMTKYFSANIQQSPLPASAENCSCRQFPNLKSPLATLQNDSMILKFGCIRFSGLDSNEQEMDTEMIPLLLILQ